MVETLPFPGGEKYRLTRGRLSVSVIPLGATVTEIVFAGRSLALGYETAADYLAGENYLGAVVGRYANRIAGARFSLDGREYRLAANEGENQLHGGPDSFDRRLWTAEIPDEYALRLRLFSPHGDNGYPGNLEAAVTYRLEEDALRLELEGQSDRDTVFGPTSHLYFNLGGGDIRQTALWINAPAYLPVDEALLPQKPAPAAGDFDFQKARPIGRAYDHAFLLAGGHACSAAAGGVRMDIFTDYPALQLYTGQGLPAPFGAFGGFALEPEFCPDSPNRPEFASPVLRAGEHFHKFIRYQFSLPKE